MSAGALAANAHFASELANGELRLDDRLRPGVVGRSNALDLMRSVGLEVQGRLVCTSLAKVGP